MLNLMTVSQNSLGNPDEVNATVALLQQTSMFVKIFGNNSSKIESEHDGHMQELLKVLISSINENKNLIIQKTKNDISSPGKPKKI